MIGALHAIATETGWDPGSADYVLGTSAGALIGALLASAVPPWLLMAYAAGEDTAGLPKLGEPGAARFGTSFRIHWSFPRPVLGSPSLALRSIREPWKYGPAGIIAWLPHGVISTEPLKTVVRDVVPNGWGPHEKLWIPAIDYKTGERIVFGREGAPRASLPDAVAASCAIPGFYYPVEIRGRKYVDGGMYSPANLDLMADAAVDLIVCLNPMSSRYRGGLFAATGAIASFVRGDNRRLLDREALAVRRLGKRVVLIEPRADDIRAMGFNYMSRRNLDQVVETAVKTTAASFRGTEIGRLLSSLPPGRPERLRRPHRSPSTWPRELFPPVLRTA
jgi:NTE family protein